MMDLKTSINNAVVNYNIVILILLGIILFIIVVVLVIFCTIKLINLKESSILNFAQGKIRSKFSKIKFNDWIPFINNMTSTLARLSVDKVGALIIIENTDNLNKYIELGNKIDCPFFPELIYTIFDNHKSPLHDGAMIIRNRRIVSVSSYLPISKRVLEVKYGARHRAGFGITERTDALAIVVSETTGNITCMHLDDVFNLSTSPEKLANDLLKILGSVIFSARENYQLEEVHH